MAQGGKACTYNTSGMHVCTSKVGKVCTYLTNRHGVDCMCRAVCPSTGKADERPSQGGAGQGTDTEPSRGGIANTLAYCYGVSDAQGHIESSTQVGLRPRGQQRRLR
jgi:hypothetical protein